MNEPMGMWECISNLGIGVITIFAMWLFFKEGSK